jgi:hypothetical protein
MPMATKHFIIIISLFPLVQDSSSQALDANKVVANPKEQEELLGTVSSQAQNINYG